MKKVHLTEEIEIEVADTDEVIPLLRPNPFSFSNDEHNCVCAELLTWLIADNDGNSYGSFDTYDEAEEELEMLIARMGQDKADQLELDIIGIE